MSTFFHDLLTYRFLQCAVLAGLLAAVPAGVVGSLVVVRRTTYLAGAISHCVMAGIGLACYLRLAHGLTWISPTLGAMLAALAAALLIALSTRHGRHGTDSVLSTIWAVGMAIGVSFMAVTPGYQTDLMSYLFGNILMVSPADLGWMLGLGTIVTLAALLCFNKLLAIGFSSEMARLRGIRVDLYEGIFLALTAITIVMLVKVVGIVMALALLTLPAATASLLTRRLDRMMLIAVGLAMLVTFSGLAVSHVPELPAGATIVELAALLYVGVALATRVRRGQAR